MIKKKERIAKIMASMGLCSRRDAEKWILDGRVQINGAILTTPACLVDESDTILVDNKPLVIAEQTPRMWCYHKPAGLITTHKDPRGRPTVFSALPSYLPRVISVGRLDFNTEGLLLLTTSGEVARMLELPSKGLKRRYRVRIHGKLKPFMIEKLQKGLTIEGIRYAPCEISVEKMQGSNTWVLITLVEGKNREIRKLMSYFNLEVTRLIRIAYGPFQLGTLQKGEVREITKKAVKDLLCE